MKLPCEECGAQCCTNPTFTRKEFNVVKEKYGIPALAKVLDPGIDFVVLQDKCPYLVKGRCSIYEDRPKVCREYGINPTMPCMYLYGRK